MYLVQTQRTLTYLLVVMDVVMGAEPAVVVVVLVVIVPVVLGVPPALVVPGVIVTQPVADIHTHI